MFTLNPDQANENVWIYDEAHVVVLSEKVYCPPRLTLMLDPMQS